MSAGVRAVIVELDELRGRDLTLDELERFVALHDRLRELTGADTFEASSARLRLALRRLGRDLLAAAGIRRRA